MTEILDKLYVEHGVHGARVIARSHISPPPARRRKRSRPGIQMLKDDLDACEREMRRLLSINRASLFEGWPSAAEDVQTDTSQHL